MVKYQIDFLSPQISLFYDGRKRHTSNIGTLLTIIMIFLSGIYIFYLIYNIAEHNFSNFMFYKNYLDDAGLYLFNDTGGIFHYFQIYDYKNQIYGQFNTKYVRVYMSRIYYKNNEDNSLINNEHWVYDYCRDGLDNKNIPKEVFENNDFNNGVCLRYYYDNNKGKYFPIEDIDNFKYPYLIHGSGRNDNLLLETVIEKCDNNSIISEVLGPCGNENEIEDYLEIHKAIYFHLLENQVNTENYSKSIYQFIYSISGSLDSINVPVNNVNLIPFLIEIKKGIFLPIKQKMVTYLFDDNRKTTFENSNNKNFLAIFDYWLVNSCQVIKGGYSNLYDILPNIGGIIQLIYYIFYSINLLYNKYIIIKDCNKLFFKIYSKDNIEKEESYIRKKFINYVNSVREEIQLKRQKSELKRKQKIKIKKNYNNISNERKAHIKRFENNKVIKTDINSNKKMLNYINKNSNKNELINNSNIFSNSNDLIIEIQKNKNIMPNNTNMDNFKKKKRILFSEDNLKLYDINIINNKNEELKKNKNNKMNFLYYHFNYQLKEYITHKNNEFKYEPLNRNIISQFLTFFNYFISLIIRNHHKERVFFILNRFRKKILGEENLFRTKIYLYLLEKYFSVREIEKIDILELYDN